MGGIKKMTESIAENISKEIRRQEAIVPAPTDEKDLFKPNKNNFVKYKMEQLKAYCIIKKKVKNLLEEIQEIEKYGLNRKSKGILLYQEHSNYNKNLSEYERKERVLEYLKVEYQRVYPIYEAYSTRFVIYECSECFDVWRLKQIEGMTEKEIKATYSILGKKSTYTVKKATDRLKEIIMLEDPQIFQYWNL